MHTEQYQESLKHWGNTLEFRLVTTVSSASHKTLGL